VFEFSENSFDGVPISIPFSVKSEPSSGQRSLEVLSSIDQKHGGFDVVVLANFSENLG